MREWTDFRGARWPLITSRRRLKFKYPAHAALRCHVYHRDGFQCVLCGARAIAVPKSYDGRNTLSVETVLPSGFRDILVMDHILTLKAGGLSVVENLQTLCETCNKHKQIIDKAAIVSYLRRVH